MKHIRLLKTEEIRLCLIFLKLSNLYFYLTVNDLIMIELLDICMIYWWCDWRMKDGLLNNKNTNFPKVFKVFPFIYFLLFSDRFSQVIVCVNLHEHTLFFHFTYLFLHIFTFFFKSSLDSCRQSLGPLGASTWFWRFIKMLPWSAIFSSICSCLRSSSISVTLLHDSVMQTVQDWGTRYHSGY